MPSLVREVLATPGSGLDNPTRALMEARFGHDFGTVRVHTGAKADASATVVGARAYTVGDHIVFSAGSYAPATGAGRLTLAHELAHVVQQRHGPVDGTAAADGLRISDPADRFEQEADRVARQVARPPADSAACLVRTTGTMMAAGPATQNPGDAGWTMQRACGSPPTPGPGPDHGHGHGEVLRIQRFASQEHVRLGDEAEPGQKVLVTGFGQISYGEMIALGDYFSSIREIESLADHPDGRAQISYALWKVNPAGRPCPASHPAAEKEVEDRYYRLLVLNETHFSTGSSAGKSNREQYAALHREALSAAWHQGLNPLVVRRSDWQAQEAFAEHFLTDAFSAGHVRTQRGAIQRHWEHLYPNFRQDLVATIACYMATYINERDFPNVLTSPATVLPEIALAALLRHLIAERIQSLGGTQLSAFSIGDLISVVLHNADNAGLDVISRQNPEGTGPAHWRAVGDTHLFPSESDTTVSATARSAASRTAQFAEAAIRLSFAECQRAERAGRAGDPLSPLLEESAFRALALLPAEDPTSPANPSYIWQVPSISDLPLPMRKLIQEAFNGGNELRDKLDKMDDNVPETTPTPLGDLHTRDAWKCFKSVLLHDVLHMLVLIGSGQTCPPGMLNPCPTIQAGRHVHDKIVVTL